ncbi:MAG: DNA translocase FtsK [Phyllobacterium sp.]
MNAGNDEEKRIGGPVSAEWQNAFALAPNVRFTRTPDSDLPKSEAESQEPPVTPRPVAAEQSTGPAIAAPPPTPAPRVPVSAQPRPAIFVRPQATTNPVVRNAISAVSQKPLPAVPTPMAKPMRPEPAFEPEMASVPCFIVSKTASKPASAPAPEVVSRPATQTQLGPEVRIVPDARMANLSDYAFWDVMAFAEASVPVRSPVPPVQAVARHEPVAPPRKEAEAITAMFKMVEIRPASHSRDERASRSTAPDKPDTGLPEITGAATPVVAALPPVVELVPAEDIVSADQSGAAFENDHPAQAGDEIIAVDTPRRRAIIHPEVSVMSYASAPAEKPTALQGEYELPPHSLLQEPPGRVGEIMTQETLERNAGLLESVLEDFGVRGEIIHVRPGPVVTLYEFEPAPGVKSSRVINLADDIARSMSALSARVAVVPGRNVIGIELPNVTRETVYFREMIDSSDFRKTNCKLALGLGKTIGGEPVIAELAKMPHLLVAGTTGSGKSVAINTMILSLLYRMTPEECRLIMVDPKMLELSVYDGIPHLLTPVVTDPKKAVMALKWAVREMEERYRKMSRMGVRNIDGYNARAAVARDKGETVSYTVQTGFEKGTGEAIYHEEAMDLSPMPYIVVIVDEMADLMMVAGKEIEGAIQRLAQMARAAGIHLIMATQRPSVDVITGTIKANFPTRISFQVTSKIDSRTILGEQGAEQLLGQGDMLHMAGGGRISRVHGPFVSDEEVEKVVAHLKTQGRPEYLDTVTAEEDEEPEEQDTAVFDKTAMGGDDTNELYAQAVKVVMRDKKCSTSYIQRRLQIGYNRAASLVERMEQDGLVGPANHVGKREILSGNRDQSSHGVNEVD